MNWEHVKADWDEVKGSVKSKWGKLTDDDLRTVSGKWDELVGKLRHRYGYAKDQAEREVNEFLKKAGTPPAPPRT
ncbi:MAG: CsbD family protein [Polyangiaceae bacterium]